MSKKVLIVEDEIFVALEIEQIVEDAGFDVGAIAADRAAALAGAASCDIALVDLNLRDGPTGPQIGMELASQHGIRVIYVTANPAQIGEASVAALGVIMKPFRAEHRGGAATGGGRAARTGGGGNCGLYAVPAARLMERDGIQRLRHRPSARQSR